MQTVEHVGDQTILRGVPLRARVDEPDGHGAQRMRWLGEGGKGSETTIRVLCFVFRKRDEHGPNEGFRLRWGRNVLKHQKREILGGNINMNTFLG